MTSKRQTPVKRLAAVDAVRGATIISMVAFHATYDAAYLYGFDLPWFTAGPVQDLWRISISWIFLLLAGWMATLSRNNIRRGAQYALAALVVWLATSIASVDEAINFGIIFCMAASTFIAACLAPLSNARHPWIWALMAVLLFAITYQVPHTLWPWSGFAWLGFPYAGFSSSDYYPILPYTFLYLAGMFAAQQYRLSHKAYPSWLYRDPIPLPSVIGRHSLIIYLLHQPILIFLFELFA